MGNIHISETFFVVFVGAYYSRWLSNYIKLHDLLFYEWWVGGLCKIPNVRRREGDPNFGHFVIIECPLIQKFKG